MHEIIHYTISSNVIEENKCRIGWTVGGIILVPRPKEKIPITICDWALKNKGSIIVEVWWEESRRTNKKYPHPEQSTFELRVYAETNALVRFDDGAIIAINVMHCIEWDNSGQYTLGNKRELVIEITPI